MLLIKRDLKYFKVCFLILSIQSACILFLSMIWNNDTFSILISNCPCIEKKIYLFLIEAISALPYIDCVYLGSILGYCLPLVYLSVTGLSIYCLNSIAIQYVLKHGRISPSSSFSQLTPLLSVLLQYIITNLSCSVKNTTGILTGITLTLKTSWRRIDLCTPLRLPAHKHI